MRDTTQGYYIFHASEFFICSSSITSISILHHPFLFIFSTLVLFLGHYRANPMDVPLFTQSLSLAGEGGAVHSAFDFSSTLGDW